MGRLTDEVMDHYDDLLDFTDKYVYDLVGNRLTKTRDNGSDQSIDETVAYSYDTNDRLLTETKDLLSGTDTTTTNSWGTGKGATFQTGK